ncbi:hypothetical protein AWB91_23550 [Mycobacterium paraense]|jgi:hypothetical protein|uniref:DUF732 domain-containing protein n=1 Tax=Mycobacterium paraense TaxID=767916 RepID=A0A1X2A6V1_9MYCO|nr:DUF732 domain-containing protein [Mycobacterium paraense]MCV7440867.1 DUF732 domain-containing protein [Mycobacterium paraense]ORW29024.1 hypothetical protein AWB91_23550 [Mycobacterium paraense]ORW35730.1 hypothetical protein AWB88_26270 [Mycobacterium paraense]ORW42169.1 hypothetical protein AWB90_19705 [Mycobacterium paraense]ORW45427.1 hypothetical protein AWB89_15010 [Mycobacterium paraense]
MFSTRITAAVATALGTAAVGLAVATAGAAGATTFSANQDAIQAGHQVCSELAAGKSKAAVALMLTTQARMSPRQAGHFVAAATKFYCPQFAGQAA